MKPSDQNSALAFRRPASGRRWLLAAMARFRFGLTGKDGRPFFDDEIIAAACECPALTYDLLVATREDVAADRGERDAAGRPAAGVVRNDGRGSRIGVRDSGGFNHGRRSTT
jgi:hypothetical protein